MKCPRFAINPRIVKVLLALCVVAGLKLTVLGALGLDLWEQLAEQDLLPIPKALAGQAESAALGIYSAARDYAGKRGIIIADTKFEFGTVKENGQEKLILIDEVLTPDSSRFWPMSDYAPGRGQQSFDKQFLRDWLEEIKFDKRPPAPKIPQSIIDQTRAKYLEAYRLLTGRDLGV